ncbi:MAG: TadE/TadG family type IV pilus assembly protein [Pseudomonadota bacterium]
MMKTKGLWRKLRAFTRATSANVAMMFGLSLLPLAIAAGAGLDYAQAMMVRANMMDALDAAALAVGAQPGISQTAANTLAKAAFDANYKGPGNPTITPQFNGQSVSVTASDNVATTLLSLVDMPTIAVSATSVAVWGQTKLWVSLVLDNTGSMCEPDSNPCPNDTNVNIKINALKTASHQLLGKLQSAAVNPGDVQVAIVPFAKDVNVGTAHVGDAWIDWSDWNVQYGTAPASSVGPGSSCPLGLGCVNGPGSTSGVSNVPSSGMICPKAVSSSSSGQTGHYYDGCYNSIQQAKVTVTTAATPVTDKQSCKTISNVNGGAASCSSNSGYPKNGTANSSNVVSYTPNYTGDSTTATPPATSNSSTSNTTQSCSTTSGVKTCTWTRTITYTSTVVTTVKTASGIYDHAWVVNDHSVWSGCVMDRNQNDDTTNVTPGNNFPAENDQSCAVATVMPLSYDWTALNAKIDTMVANGGTNQTIGLAHGMQLQATGDPYNAPTLPANTSRYIILLSDGLNTMDRWYGNGSAQSASVDTRMAAACTYAKTHEHFIIYTLFVDLNGTQGNSTVLKNCATDASKYYDLTQASQIALAFNQIADQITNLRVSH